LVASLGYEPAMNRRILLEGVDNFRDYGGYAASAGRRLRSGALYRSAGHARATDADLETIAALGISTIVDLRRPDERRRDPARRHPHFQGSVISNADEAVDDWRAHIQSGDITEEGFRRYMVAYYDKAPFEPRHLDLFGRYFRALADGGGPILIHCSAGKDRTGLLAALTHRLAGVHRDDIVEDFLLTNDPERLAARLPLVAAIVAEVAGKVPSEGALMVAMGVEAHYLETAFAAIEARFGGPDAYMEQALGVDRAVRAAIEARLLT
jgi:protein-tyrosine phosphatase